MYVIIEGCGEYDDYSEEALYYTENKEEAEAFIAHVEEVIVSVSLTYLWHRFYDCIRFKCCILCEHYELHSNLTINGSPINNMECKLCKQIWSKSHSHYDSCVRNTAQFSSCDFCELFTDIEYQKVRIKPGYHLMEWHPNIDNGQTIERILDSIYDYGSGGHLFLREVSKLPKECWT